MKSIASIFQHKAIFLTGMAYGWFEVTAIPKPMLLFFLFGAMAVDFITGLLKSWGLGLATSSSGFRKTVSKVGMYAGAIMGMWFIANMLGLMYPTKTVDYSVLVNGSIGFITFIEIYSIFENIYQISPNGQLSRLFIKPVLKFLKGKLENNHPLKDIDNGKQDQASGS